MDDPGYNFDENAVVEVISKLIEELEKKFLQDKIKIKECEELKLLKQKCCNSEVIVSLSAFHGIRYLVERKILVRTQTISMLVSLLPSIKHYGGLVSTIGNILLADFHHQIYESGKYECFYYVQSQHPFIIVLKSNLEKSWLEVYNFVFELMQLKEDMRWDHKIEFIRPFFRHIFWGSSWRGSQLQIKLFSALLMKFNKNEVMNFALETLLWQELSVHFCMFLKDFFIRLLEQNDEESEMIAFGLTPLLALATKLLIISGCNPNVWLKLLKICVERNMASGSAILYILTDVVMETPSAYIIQLVDVCKSIIFSTDCNKYVAYKFVAVTLNWFVKPSFLVNPVYETLEKIFDFITGGANNWNDRTPRLNENKYYKAYGSSKKEAKFAVVLMAACNRWDEDKTSVKDWLKNLRDSNKHQMQLKIHPFIQGIFLCEKDEIVVDVCLEILFKLIKRNKEISFSLLCLLFYKLGREVEPRMQKTYLFSIPKLPVKKENIPLIVGIIESLKRGPPKLMTPLVIQLYLSLWKFNNRTYFYLHKMLHDKGKDDYDWELNVSKAIALKEICRLAPHLHAKDLVAVLSGILNECAGDVSGLPSAIAIEAVTELCKAYVIDVAGTWNALQPKLQIDKRPEVIASLCRFFGEIPNLDSFERKKQEFTRIVVPMLWNYAFFQNKEVVKSTFRALSKFEIESLPLKFFPEIYRVDVKIPKDLLKNLKALEDVLQLPYVPAECWVQFLAKIDEEVLQDGGELVMVLIERELTSLPRGVFYLPPEKSEPLNYSYLPSRSICRGLVEHLLNRSKEDSAVAPEYLKELIRVLGHEYSKFLPPLNWSFLENFMILGGNFSRHCLALLVKQAPGSHSARSILNNYFKSEEWNLNKLEEILFFYNLMPLLCKVVSYSILEDFLERTLKLCLETTLSRNSPHFEKIMLNLTGFLRNKTVPPTHKLLIARQAEKILNSIPPEHEVMEKYATCATEFPAKLIQKITAVQKENGDVDSNRLRRALAIRIAIAMRSDIKNPLVWLSGFTEAAHSPEEQNFVLNRIWFIIRNRRDCDHREWVYEVTEKIQTSITPSISDESIKVTLYLVNVFITAIIVLSGYDCLFMDGGEFTGDESKRVEVFPLALCALSSPDWNDILLDLEPWLQKLSKWKHLPKDRANAFIQARLTLREMAFFGNKNDPSFFNFSLPVL